MRRFSSSRSLSGSDTTMRSREDSYVSDLSEWEVLMRKFADDYNHLNCKRLPVSTKARHCSKTFITGAKYEGLWNALNGMTSRGKYTFPSGVIYEGEFNEGVFHGSGEMIYPCGVTIRGRWKNGKLDRHTRMITFEDNLTYDSKNWTYCQKHDRRFTREHKKLDENFKGLQPAFQSYMTAEHPSKEIPEKFYDTGSDFYREGLGFHYNNIYRVTRGFTEDQAKWTENNCRKSQNEKVGPNIGLYEEWWDYKFPPDETPPTSQRTSMSSGSPDYPFMATRPSIGGQSTGFGGWNRKNIKFDPEVEVDSVTMN